MILSATTFFQVFGLNVLKHFKPQLSCCASTQQSPLDGSLESNFTMFASFPQMLIYIPKAWKTLINILRDQSRHISSLKTSSSFACFNGFVRDFVWKQWKPSIFILWFYKLLLATGKTNCDCNSFFKRTTLMGGIIRGEPLVFWLFVVALFWLTFWFSKSLQF